MPLGFVSVMKIFQALLRVFKLKSCYPLCSKKFVLSCSQMRQKHTKTLDSKIQYAEFLYS